MAKTRSQNQTTDQPPPIDNPTTSVPNDGDVVDIATIKPDPHNPRRRTKRSAGMIEQSLREVGPWRSISIDEENVNYAGNGVVEEAAQVGIHKVRIVDAQPDEIIAVRRRGLTDEQKRRYALFDNRTSELSEWDADELVAQESILGDMFRDDELGDIRDDAAMQAMLAEQLEAEQGLTGEGSSRVIPKRVEIRPVIYTEDVDVFERAMEKTGLEHRGEALIAMCREYLGEEPPLVAEG